MKAVVFVCAAVSFASVAALGQGQFFFNTHDTTAGNVLSFTANGAPASGSDLFVEVVAGPDSQHFTALTPLLALDRTGAGAGFTDPFSAVYTVPGMTAGQMAIVGVMGFKGTSPQTATASSGVDFVGVVVLTEPPTPPNEVSTGTKGGIEIVLNPEPSSLALLTVAGIGFLLWRKAQSSKTTMDSSTR